jgi:8-oxo-dGTP pyrophosphatase MutT (NUDIX family)
MTSSTTKRAVYAKPSATIVVLRKADPRPEMLLVKRRAGDAFGENYAFPGGVVDADESAACEFAVGTTTDQANQVLGVAHGGLDYYSAGIRELFEETGVLLARDNNGEWACDRPEFEELRSRVDKGLLPWAEFLTQQGLWMCCDALHYFAHWETPFDLTKRWSTRFFATELPAGQSACHDGFETTDSRWLSATEALEQTMSGVIDMPYPTIKTLERLQQFATIPDLFAWARAEQESGIDLNCLDSPDGLTRRGMRK